MAGLLLLLEFLFQFVAIIADNKHCRVTNMGTEYAGTISKSVTGADCLYWNAVKEMRGEDFVDLRFPDGSKKTARNYCRNPSRESTGPWCYVKNNGLQKELCHVPFCLFNDCRWTGIGEEYSGTVHNTISTESCANWINTSYSEKSNSICSNGSCGNCRNLDSSSSGPWCVLTDLNQRQEKRLCDIPFCQIAPVIVGEGEFSDSHPITTFHKISNESTVQLKFRLWDPSDWLTGEIILLLSVFDVPEVPNQIQKWNSAVFIKMGNAHSFIIFKKVADHIETPGIISSMKWTNLTVTWKRTTDHFLVYVHTNENEKALLVAELNVTDTYLENHEFKYFSVLGIRSFFDFSITPQTCLITTSSLGNKPLWFLMEKDFAESVVQLFFKTYGVIVVSFRETFLDVDLLRVNIAQNGNIFVEEISKDGVEKVISDATISPFDFSSWNQINITILGDSLLITRLLENNLEVAANLTGIPRNILWFGVSSKEVSYWSLDCNPKNTADEEKNAQDCSTTSAAFDYRGSSNIGPSGKTCVPWMDKRIPTKYQNISLFNRFGGRLGSLNHCRNLDNDPTGPFCFVAGSRLEKEKCHIPACVMEECKIAGTGADYFGKLSKTKSGRICHNETFCRNPTKDIGGPWCETGDFLVPRDLCLVEDCDFHSSEILLTSKETSGHNWYILPNWKKSGIKFWIKNWDPDNDSTFSITIRELSGKSAYKLIIGGSSNEELVLLFITDNTEKHLYRETVSHILKSGKWTGLWLKFKRGCIELGHENMALPFFEWEAGPTEEDVILDPSFINFGTLQYYVGIRFLPNECFVEQLSDKSSHLWPINLWRKGQDSNVIDFYVQGDGNFSIHFIQIPDDGVKITLGVNYREIAVFSQGILQNSLVLNDAVLNSETWTKISVWFDENNFKVTVENETVLEYTPKEIIFIFYWFKFECLSGEVSWSANCEPLELGGQARDGGWSEWGPWTCSSSCGGGEGHRERFCNNPRPNLLGKECAGLQIYKGPCNQFPCGDAPPDLLRQIRQDLASNAESLIVKKGEQVQFMCNENRAKILMNHVPNVTFEWVLNGFVSSSPRAVSELNDADFSDNGVWVCLANWEITDEDKFVVLSVTTLIVTSLYPTNVVRETQSFTLNCNGESLAQIFAELSQKWLHNEQVLFEFESVPLEAVAIHSVENTNLSHSGIWTCQISQNELGLHWTTAWIKLQVDPAPNFWSNLIQDEATAPIFSGMSEQTAKYFVITILLLLIFIPVALIFGFDILIKKI